MPAEEFLAAVISALKKGRYSNIGPEGRRQILMRAMEDYVNVEYNQFFEAMFDTFCLYKCNKIIIEELLEALGVRFGLSKYLAFTMLDVFTFNNLWLLRCKENGMLSDEKLSKACRKERIDESEFNIMYDDYIKNGGLRGYYAELSKSRSIQIVEKFVR